MLSNGVKGGSLRHRCYHDYEPCPTAFATSLLAFCVKAASDDDDDDNAALLLCHT